MMKSWIGAAATAAVLLAPKLASAQTGGLEVRFCPAAQIRTYPLESHRGIQSLVLQNVAVINNGPAPVDVTGLDISLQQAGETLDTRRIAPADLTKVADHGRKLQASGAMTLYAFQFCGKALIGDGIKLSGPRLEPGQAMLLTYQTFAFNGERDALRVTVQAATPRARSPPAPQSPSAPRFRRPCSAFP
jgi:hypothetical protein